MQVLSKLHMRANRLAEIYRNEGTKGVTSRILNKVRSPISEEITHEVLISKFSPSSAELASMKQAAKDFAYQPLITILLPTYNTDRSFLIDVIESVQNQVYQNWELCIADDASTVSHVRELLNEYQAKDSRIRVVFREKNGHISAASNSALEIARGEYVALLDHDDILAPHALFEVVKLLQDNRELGIIYSNEDKIDISGRRSEPTFKSSFSFDYFSSFMYIGHLTVYSRALIERAGRFRVGYEGSQDYDLALRAIALGPKIKHIPAILYHWRKHPGSVAAEIHCKPYAFESAKKALGDAWAARGFEGTEILSTKYTGIYHPKLPLKETPLISIIVVGGGGAGDLKKSTNYPQIEVRCLEESNATRCESLKKTLDHTHGKWIVLLDSNLTPTSPDWLDTLAPYMQRSEVGAVFGKVTTHSNTISHAGYSFAGKHVIRNFYGLCADSPGYGARLGASHNISAAPTEFVLLRKADLINCGVLEQPYKSEVGFDIALSLALKELGKELIWCPHAEMTGSTTLEASIDLRKFQSDYALLRDKYGFDGLADPHLPQGLQAGSFRVQF